MESYSCFFDESGLYANVLKLGILFLCSQRIFYLCCKALKHVFELFQDEVLCLVFMQLFQNCIVMLLLCICALLRLLALMLIQLASFYVKACRNA